MVPINLWPNKPFNPIARKNARSGLTATLGGNMPYLRRLFRVELAAQISLVACALLFAIVMIVGALLGTNLPFEGEGATMSAVGASVMLAFIVYLYCLGPVALLIAPIYAVLDARGRANAVTSACVGLVPGLLMLIYSVTPISVSRSVSSLVPLGCLATGVSITTGIHLIRTWNQP